MQVSERALWNAFHNANCKSSREKLIISHQHIVKNSVWRLTRDLPQYVDRDDLRQLGMIGLIGAVESYRLDKGCSFDTFAKIRVAGAILDAMRANDWAPRALRSRARQLEKARNLLANEMGREPTPADVCAAVGISMAEYDNHKQAFHSALTMPLDSVMNASDSEGITRAEKINDPRAADGLDAQLAASDNQALISAISKLFPRERQVIGMFYFQEMNGREIAQALALTESRVSQLHAQALEKLQKFGPLKRELQITSRTNR